jgi:hypothetical protein
MGGMPIDVLMGGGGDTVWTNDNAYQLIDMGSGTSNGSATDRIRAVNAYEIDGSDSGDWIIGEWAGTMTAIGNGGDDKFCARFTRWTLMDGSWPALDTDSSYGTAITVTAVEQPGTIVKASCDAVRSQIAAAFSD